MSDLIVIAVLVGLVVGMLALLNKDDPNKHYEDDDWR